MSRANVILDFVFDDGLLFVSLANIGEAPASDVVVEFDEPIHAADGSDVGTTRPGLRGSGGDQGSRLARGPGSAALPPS